MVEHWCVWVFNSFTGNQQRCLSNWQRCLSSGWNRQRRLFHLVLVSCPPIYPFRQLAFVSSPLSIQQNFQMGNNADVKLIFPLTAATVNLSQEADPVKLRRNTFMRSSYIVNKQKKLSGLNAVPPLYWTPIMFAWVEDKTQHWMLINTLFLHFTSLVKKLLSAPK